MIKTVYESDEIIITQQDELSFHMQINDQIKVSNDASTLTSAINAIRNAVWALDLYSSKKIQLFITIVGSIPNAVSMQGNPNNSELKNFIVLHLDLIVNFAATRIASKILNEALVTAAIGTAADFIAPTIGNVIGATSGFVAGAGRVLFLAGVGYFSTALLSDAYDSLEIDELYQYLKNNIFKLQNQYEQETLRNPNEEELKIILNSIDENSKCLDALLHAFPNYLNTTSYSNPHPKSNKTRNFQLLIKDYASLKPLKNKHIELINIDSKKSLKRLTNNKGEALFVINEDERGDFFNVRLIDDKEYEQEPFYLAKETLKNSQQRQVYLAKEASINSQEKQAYLAKEASKNSQQKQIYLAKENSQQNQATQKILSPNNYANHQAVIYFKKKDAKVKDDINLVEELSFLEYVEWELDPKTREIKKAKEKIKIHYILDPSLQETRDAFNASQDFANITKNSFDTNQDDSHTTQKSFNATQTSSKTTQNSFYVAKNFSHTKQELTHKTQNAFNARQDFSKLTNNFLDKTQELFNATNNYSKTSQDFANITKNSFDANQDDSHKTQNSFNTSQAPSYPFAPGTYIELKARLRDDMRATRALNWAYLSLKDENELYLFKDKKLAKYDLSPLFDLSGYFNEHQMYDKIGFHLPLLECAYVIIFASTADIDIYKNTHLIINTKFKIGEISKDSIIEAKRKEDQNYKAFKFSLAKIEAQKSNDGLLASATKEALPYWNKLDLICNLEEAVNFLRSNKDKFSEFYQKHQARYANENSSFDPLFDYLRAYPSLAGKLAFLYKGFDLANEDFVGSVKGDNGEYVKDRKDFIENSKQILKKRSSSNNHPNFIDEYKQLKNLKNNKNSKKDLIKSLTETVCEQFKLSLEDLVFFNAQNAYGYYYASIIYINEDYLDLDLKEVLKTVFHELRHLYIETKYKADDTSILKKYLHYSKYFYINTAPTIFDGFYKSCKVDEAVKVGCTVNTKQNAYEIQPSERDPRYVEMQIAKILP
ncbi:hypothetical protein [Campylobacter troglodytis]|uniref:hypothetical protein n=1 Tax=Campylobacter troglodytis TaxID=654363 RepID=UPI0011582755|nr:hypothetical protein [Campylobacter troglodytis]TQR53508.1 hypothetical protein DMC01_11190 [Campylobacter troglodytis]